MNAKQRRTHKSIFTDPIKPDIPWKDVESLPLALGAYITEGQGSRVRVKLAGERAVFHRPHPERVTDRGAVKSVRKFLINAGFGEEFGQE